MPKRLTLTIQEGKKQTQIFARTWQELEAKVPAAVKKATKKVTLEKE